MRGSTWLIVLGTVACLLLVVVAPLAAGQGTRLGRSVGYSYHSTRAESLTDSTVTGYLTWNGGKGSIRWDPSAPSEDPAAGTASSTADDTVRLATDTVTDWTSVYLNTPLRFDFVSDPVPVDLYLNVSRLVQVVLRITGPSWTYNGDVCYDQSDPKIDVELRLGDRLIAGGVWGQYTNLWYPGVTIEPDPAGYGTCRFRMPSEAALIPKGSILKLTVIQVSQSRNFQYGFADDHRSFVVFPVYPEEELAFRKIGPHAPSTPEAGGPGAAGDEAPPVEPKEPEAPSAPAGAVASLGIVGVAGLALGRNRRAYLLISLLLAGAFAGCMGGSGTSEVTADPSSVAGTATASYRPAPEIKGGVGTVLGVILDDLGYPVGGAHVSLLGTSNSTSSDGKGKFTLRNIAPSGYTLRVDRETYRSLETPIVVQAGTITSVEVTLQPLEDRTADQRPHKHDYWSGRTEVQIMNQPIGHYCYFQAGGVGTDCFITTYFRIPSPEGDDYRSILPGTSEVEVKLNWNPAELGVPRIGLMFAGGNDWNYSALYPRGPGEPFRIQTNWEMTDPGHQPFSDWSLQIYAANQDQPNSWGSFVLTWSPLPVPPIHAQITVRKGGQMPLEPAHPDPWGGNSTMVVLKNAIGYGVTCLVPESALLYCYDVSYFYPQKPIPAETTWLEVELRQSRATTPAYGWDLFYKPANGGDYAQCTNTCQGVPGVKKAPDPKVSGLVSKYVIPVEPGEADPIYKKQSNWNLLVEADDANAQFVDGWSQILSQLTFSVTVTAHRDARPT